MYNLDKVTQKDIKRPLLFQHEQMWKHYEVVTTTDNMGIKYHVICSWWFSIGDATKKIHVGTLKVVRYLTFPL